MEFKQGRLHDTHPDVENGTHWIFARIPTNSGRGDWEAAKEEYQARLRAKKRPTTTYLDELAKRHNVLSGKWCLFYKTHQLVDEGSEEAGVWARIRDSLFKGQLGDSAKIAPRSTNETHVICVYVSDYFDRSMIGNTLSHLRSLGLRASLSFKPDLYTYLDIYKGNEKVTRAPISTHGIPLHVC